jgi:protein TonB
MLLAAALHAVPLGLLAYRVSFTPAEALDPYGDSDREGFDVEAIALDPGTWRQGDQYTPGGDGQSSGVTVAVQPPVEEPAAPPVTVPEKPVDPPPAPKPTETKSAATTGDGAKPRDGLAGAPGGSDMKLGTPSRGGTVGITSGAKMIGRGRYNYPPEAERLGLEGWPEVWMRISAEGAVVEVKLHKSCGHDLLDRAALHYAKAFKFRPARQGDTPVESTLVYRIRYELE